MRFAIPAGLTEIRKTRRILRRISPNSINDSWMAACSPHTRRSLAASRLAFVPKELLQEPECVVDVGAHVGSWSKAVLHFVNPRQLIAVEPTPDTFAQLKKTIGGLPNVRLVQCAVGAKCGKATFNVMGSSDFNSLLPITDEVRNNYPHVGESRQITVDVTPLDDLLKDVAVITLLKIDVQGGEIPALEGARATLARTRSVLLEANLVSHYHGDTLFQDLHKCMTEQFGFDLCNIAPPYYNAEDRALWADVVFVKKDGVSGGKK